MIPPAPTDFWQRVIDRMAQLIFEREVRLGSGNTHSGVTTVTTTGVDMRTIVPLQPPRSDPGGRDAG